MLAQQIEAFFHADSHHLRAKFVVTVGVISTVALTVTGNETTAILTSCATNLIWIWE